MSKIVSLELIENSKRSPYSLDRIKFIMGKYAEFRHKPKDGWSRFYCCDWLIHMTVLPDERIAMFQANGGDIRELPKIRKDGFIAIPSDLISSEAEAVEYFREWKDELSEYDRYCAGY